MRVAFLAPTRQGYTFFYEVTADLMRVAARQLEIELEIVEGTLEHDTIVKRGLEIAARATRPDYVILANAMGVASELLPAFAEARIRTLLVVEGLGRGDQLAIGRAGCATYLGEIVPNDLEAGRLLADTLVTEARRRGLARADGNVHVGIVAARQTLVDSQRFRGWQTFKDGKPDVVQSGFQYGGWEENGGRAAIKMLLTTAPKTGVLWCFNDALAMRAVGAATEMGVKPGEDVLIGGIDLLQSALAGIVEGTIHVSVGGHIVDGVRALLLLHDHHEKGDLTVTTRTTRMEAVKVNEAERYLQFMKKQAWRDVDFTRFSARRNPSQSRPELSLHALVFG